jgi:hypothetical protein
MRQAPIVIALMIGELDYMPVLNAISRAIVARAVAVWRSTPGAALVCESEPMALEAIRLGVARGDVVTALPQSLGHTTRLVAQWMAASEFAQRPAILVTHAMHAPRSVRIFSRLGLTAEAVSLNLPFDPRDRDWKLRSAAIFRFYNILAYAYCYARRWI